MSEPTKHTHVEIIEYDSERGVVAMFDEHNRSEYEVRAGMLDKIVRQDGSQDGSQGGMRIAGDPS